MLDYVLEHKDKIQNVPGGTLCQVFGENEGASCSVAIVTMNENGSGVKHYHKDITEIYLFSEGTGNIVINEHVNKVKEGDCFIISPNNVHYIVAKTDMKFLCICTPPWIEEREFVVTDHVVGDNIAKFDRTGIIQKFSNEAEHNVKFYEISDKFLVNENIQKYRRVYYCVSGNGVINIAGHDSVFNAGSCYEISDQTIEEIIPNGNMKFVLICDNF